MWFDPCAMNTSLVSRASCAHVQPQEKRSVSDQLKCDFRSMQQHSKQVGQQSLGIRLIAVLSTTTTIMRLPSMRWWRQQTHTNTSSKQTSFIFVTLKVSRTPLNVLHVVKTQVRMAQVPKLREVREWAHKSRVVT
jgi:hypothetical protein